MPSYEIGSPEELQYKKDELARAHEVVKQDLLKKQKELSREELNRYQESFSEDTNEQEMNDALHMARQNDIMGEYEYQKYINSISFVSPSEKDSWETLVEKSNTLNSSKLSERDNEYFDENPQIWNLLVTQKNINKLAKHLQAKYAKWQPTDSLGIWTTKINGEDRAEIHFKREGEEEYVIPFKDIR